MAAPGEPRREPAAGHELESAVERKAARHRKAAQAHSVWFSLGLFGLVGWSVAVPALLGIALGVWIDAHWPSRVSWTLTLLLLGIVGGCINAWRWISKESEER